MTVAAGAPRSAIARAAVAVLLALTLASFLADLCLSGGGVDFTAFACGGAAVASGADPYRTEPLRSCEQRRPEIAKNGSRYVVPDPLPPYDQAVLAVAARLGLKSLWYAWIALGIAAFVASAALLARVAGRSAFAVGCALFVSDFACSAPLGQLPPFCIFGIVLGGWALVERRPAALAVGLMLAAIEPHLGSAAILATLVWGDGRARFAALGACAALGALSLAAMPAGTIVEYFARVLPALAASEIDAQGQYGLAYQLHFFGVSEAASLRLGGILFGCGLVAAVALAGRCRAVFGPAAIVFVPCAAVVLVSPYLHLPQVAAAIPAAVLVASKRPSRAAGSAAALLSVPWMNFSGAVAIAPAVAFGFYTTLRGFARANVRHALWLTLAALAFLVCAASYEAAHEVGDAFRYGSVLASDLPETVWRTIVEAQEHRYPLLAEVAKLPSEVALLLLCSVVVRESLGTPGRSARRGFGRALLDRGGQVAASAQAGDVAN